MKKYPITSSYDLQVGEHLVTVSVDDYGPVARAVAKTADFGADVPVWDFFCEFAYIYGEHIRKPAMLVIPSTAFLLWMEGDRLRIEAAHPPLEGCDEPYDDEDDSPEFAA